MVITYPNQARFQTLNAALESLDLDSDEPKLIVLTAGIYRERVELRGKHIKLVGVGRVVIDGNAHATQLGEDRRPIETFKTATFYAEGTDIKLENLEIINSAGFGKFVGQAIAFYGNGDHIILNRCVIRANQDTIFLAPLPVSTSKGLPFNAPRDDHPGLQQHRYVFYQCSIFGNVDFIFGGGSALFDRCEICSIPGKENGGGYISAPSTYPQTEFGLVYLHCRLTKSSPKVSSVYLARPWRPYGKAWYIDCQLGEHIISKGWDNWNGDRQRERTSDFREYGSIPTGKKREKWSINNPKIDYKLVYQLQKFFY